MSVQSASAPFNGYRLHHFLRVLYFILVPTPFFLLGSLLIGLFSVVTLFQFRDFTMTRLVAPICRLLLRLVGIRVVYENHHLLEEFKRKQIVFVCNHLSAYDIFVMCSLGLPHTRYFLSVSTLKFVPLTIVGLCTGVFYVSEQYDGEKRVKEFKRACSTLKKSGESVLLTPEGFRNSGFILQKFNKGSFHLATELRANIHCFFIDCPKQCHPGFGLITGKGTIRVRSLGQVNTNEWKLEDLQENTNAVRELYLAEAAKRSLEN